MPLNINTFFHNVLRKMGSWSKTMEQRILCRCTTQSVKTLMTGRTVNDMENKMKWAYLDKWSMTTRIANFPFNLGKYVMKLIEISSQTDVSIGRG